MLKNTLFQYVIRLSLICVVGVTVTACGGGGSGKKSAEINVTVSSIASTLSRASNSENNRISSSSLSSSSIISNNSSKISGSDKIPITKIIFPTPVSMTEGNDVLVRGILNNHLNKIVSIKVNGLQAITNDEYSTWQVRVPLVPGVNALSVSVADDKGNVNLNAATAKITRTVFINHPDNIVIDTSHNRALVADSELDAIVAMDLTTGARTILSNATVPNSENMFSGSVHIALDSAHNRALLVDEALTNVITLDLTTGARAVLSNFTQNVSDTISNTLTDIAVDAGHNRALIIYGRDIMAVDLTSGKRTLFMNGSTSGITPHQLIVDDVHSRVLILDKLNDTIFTADLITGISNVLSNTTIPNGYSTLFNPSAFALDRTHNRALVIQPEAMIIGVDLDTGARVPLANKFTPDSTMTSNPVSISVDQLNNRALIADGGNSSIVAMDLTTGVRTSLFSNSIPNVKNSLASAEDIALDDAHNRALVVDRKLNAIIGVDLSTSERTILCNLKMPRGIAIDIAHNRALAVDMGQHAVIAMNLATDTCAALPNISAGLDEVTGLTVDSNMNMAMVLYRQGVTFIDLATDTSYGGANLTVIKPTLNPSGIVIDSSHNRYLIAGDVQSHFSGAYVGVVVTMDFSNYSPTFWVDNEYSFDNVLSDPGGIAIDSAHNRILLSDFEKIIAVDLISSESKILSGAATSNSINMLKYPRGIALNSANNFALVTDSTLQAILAVDLITGERVYFSK